MAKTEKEIKTLYKSLHDDLSEIYYDGIFAGWGLTKEEFTVQHGLIWKAMEDELTAGGFLRPPEPRRDLLAEFDALKERVKALGG